MVCCVPCIRTTITEHHQKDSASVQHPLPRGTYQQSDASSGGSSMRLGIGRDAGEKVVNEQDQHRWRVGEKTKQKKKMSAPQASDILLSSEQQQQQQTLDTTNSGRSKASEKTLSPAEVALPLQAVLTVLRLLAADPILPCLLFLLVHRLHLLLPILFIMPPVIGDAGEPGRHCRTGRAEGATCRHIWSFSCVCLCIYTLFVATYVLLSWTCYLCYFSHLILNMRNVCKAQWVCVDQRIVLYESYLGSNNDLGSKQRE